MALNADILGAALYAKAQEWNNKTPDELGDMELARQAFWKAIAQEVIDHFKTNAVIPSTGLTAPNGPVGGFAKIQ